jgi:hypothetical protein
MKLISNNLVLALALVLISATASFADICVPGTPGFNPGDCIDAGGNIGTAFGSNGSAPGGASGSGAGAVPIDGGAGFLIAGGFAYGAKRYRALKAKKA